MMITTSPHASVSSAVTINTLILQLTVALCRKMCYISLVGQPILKIVETGSGEWTYTRFCSQVPYIAKSYGTIMLVCTVLKLQCSALINGIYDCMRPSKGFNVIVASSFLALLKDNVESFLKGGVWLQHILTLMVRTSHLMMSCAFQGDKQM